MQEFKKVCGEIDDEKVADAIGRLCYNIETALPCGFEVIIEKAEAK